MNEKAGNFQLLEPTRPEALIPDSWVEPWMFVVGIVALLALLAVALFKRKNAAGENTAEVRRAAHAAAIAALDKISAETPPREAAVQASLIVRRYLSVAAADPALFETHEEYISRHDALIKFSVEAREAAAAGFSRLATYKYAAEPPAVESATLVAEARALLETLHHGFQA